MEPEICDPEKTSQEEDTEKEEVSDEEMDISENAGWADAMSKVLCTQPKTGKRLILAKAKHDSDVKKKKSGTEVEIIGDKGEIRKDDSDSEAHHISSKEQKRKEMLEKQAKRQAWENMCRSKPDMLNRDKERQLMRTATRSVVQLFNAVQKHQKRKDEKIQGITSKKESRKKEKAAKGNFLDILKSTVVKSENPTNKDKSESKQETWSVLKDDFLMGSTLKDWDKSSDDGT